MGLDIDFYVFKNKFKKDDIDNETPALYLRKPYLIYEDIKKLTDWKYDYCFTKNELIVLKDKLELLIFNFESIYKHTYGDDGTYTDISYTDTMIYNLKKYVDLHQLICDVLRNNEKLLYVVITP